ncbi:MAG: hypothetical protein ACFFDL_14820 [Promethearchaeota archaeon]
MRLLEDHKLQNASVYSRIGRINSPKRMVFPYPFPVPKNFTFFT